MNGITILKDFIRVAESEKKVVDAVYKVSIITGVQIVVYCCFKDLY